MAESLRSGRASGPARLPCSPQGLGLDEAPSGESTIRRMTIGLITRPATTADAPALVALVNSAYRGDSSKAGWTTEADLLGGQRVDVEGLTETIARPSNVILLHERDRVPLACVGASVAALRAHPLSRTVLVGRGPEAHRRDAARGRVRPLHVRIDAADRRPGSSGEALRDSAVGSAR